MFWVDEVADEIIKTYADKNELIVRDEKTLSGRVHVGSLRGVVLHGVVAQALREKGKNAHFIYELNDIDPMDGMPIYLDPAEFKQHMGKPLRNVPSPDGKAKNFADYFGQEFVKVIDALGLNVEYSVASDKYDAGLYDPWIQKVMEHESEIRRIYKDISGSEKPDDWHPLQVVCENCGKVGTTRVTGWDGEKASYVCVPDMVKWAEGCGHTGKIVPFKGVGKLPWKVEWPVKWAVYNVDVEGSGKDHSAAGGSYDVATEICSKVLGIKVPYNLPYEFFLFGGAKMSSSKGEGATAHAMSELLPPELIRFLMIRSRPNQPIEFNPEGETIPRLFDRYDECADHYFANVEEVNPDFQRAFYYSQTDTKNIKDSYRPRFSRLVFMLQIPHLNIEEEIAKLKGSALNDEDKKELDKRLHYVKLWLEQYASDTFKFSVQESIPDAAYDLSDEQKKFLADITVELEAKERSGEELHAKIHEIRKASTLEPREGFAAIYMALIGRDSGPQAGWFLDALDRDFVVNRFKEVVKLPKREKPVIEDASGKTLTIKSEIVEKFPGLKIGVAIIRGLKIEKENPDLDKLRAEILGSLNFEDLKKNSPILNEYKEIFRAMGVQPTKNKPSPVALVDRLANGKELPKINTLVDVYNLMVLKYQVSIGAFDLSKIALPIELRFSKKGEIFTDLADQKDKPLENGEIIYSDKNGIVMARDLNFRDNYNVIVKDDTVDILLQCDGISTTSQEYVEKAFRETVDMILKYCGGTLEEIEFVTT
jgi:lysyl-tRNA synthetase class 1